MLKFLLRRDEPTDEEFFAAFCEDNLRAIQLAARRVLGRDELAWDAAQETICKLARQVGKLRQMDEGQRNAYVYQAARRNALSLAAAEARHRHAELTEQPEGGGAEARLVAKDRRCSAAE